MAYIFNDAEKNEVRAYFPGLEFNIEEDVTVLSGRIIVNAVYNGIEICDKFEIKIYVTEEYPEKIPEVAEVGGRTESIIKKRKISNILDLHCKNLILKTFCLCAKPEEEIKFPTGSNLVHFIDNLVIPFFYSLSFYEKYGYWPWGDYSHGSEGNIEWYLEKRFPITKEKALRVLSALKNDKKWNIYRMLLKKHGFIRSHTNCSCGSILKFRNCHPNALNGLQSLKVDIANLNIEI